MDTLEIGTWILQVFCYAQDKKVSRRHWQVYQGKSFWWMRYYILPFEDGLWKSCWETTGLEYWSTSDFLEIFIVALRFNAVRFLEF